MSKHIIIIIYFLISVSIIYGQERNLSKEQMYEDFDEMVSIINDCNPQLSIRKYVTGVDQMEMVLNLRPMIDTITNNDSFLAVLNRMLVYMCDIHALRATSIYPSDNLDGIDTNAIKSYNQYLFRKMMEQEEVYDPYQPYCIPKYINGDYYMIGRYSLINRNTKDTLTLSDAKLIAFDGIPYQEYIFQTPFGMRWDNTRKQYYAISSYFPARKGILTVVNNGKQIDIRQADYQDMITGAIPKYRSYKYEGLPRYSSSNKSKVIYFEKEKVLYVYLDKMIDDKGEIAKEIKQLGHGKPIRKVVIDVRNNSGGNDIGWHYVLQAIIADTLPNVATSALLNSERNRKLYQDGKIFGNFNELPIKNINNLTNTNEEFIIAKSTGSYFIPDKNSLNYKGLIYIIQNEESYSSAQAFPSYARHIDQLVSVGVPTGLFGGRGIAAALFQLKHSKFSFRLGTLLDITNANSPIDVYQNIPEIIIEIPTEEKLRELNHYRIYDLHSKEYLYNYDYTFKKILDLK